MKKKVGTNFYFGTDFIFYLNKSVLEVGTKETSLSRSSSRNKKIEKKCSFLGERGGTTAPVNGFSCGTCPQFKILFSMNYLFFSFYK